MRRAAACFVLAMLAFFPAGAIAESGRSGGIAITDAWARPTLKGATTGAVYMTITNRGSKMERLTAIQTPAAARAELHEDVMTGGVMSMRPVDDFTIAPGASVAIAPGHYHIMLMELKSPLAAGGNLALRLVFEQTGAIDLFVPVTADPPAPAMHMH